MLNSAARFLAPTAARFPDRVAVEDEWGAFTWRELEEAVVRTASALLARGLERLCAAGHGDQGWHRWRFQLCKG